jgi:hypothetical protein
MGDFASISCLETHIPSGLVGLELQCVPKVDVAGAVEVEWQDVVTGEAAVHEPCKLVNCTPPTAPTNGTVEGGATTPGTQWSLTCDPGFRVVAGPAVSSCSPNSGEFTKFGICIQADVNVIELAKIRGTISMTIVIPLGQTLEMLQQDAAFMDSIARSIADGFTLAGVAVERDQITELTLERKSRRLLERPALGRRLADADVVVSYTIKATSVAHATLMVDLLADPSTSGIFASNFADAMWRHTGIEVTGVTASVPIMEVEIIYLTTPTPITEAPGIVNPDSTGEEDSGIDSAVVIGIIGGSIASLCCIFGCIVIFRKRIKMWILPEDRRRYGKSRDYSAGLDEIVPVAERRSTRSVSLTSHGSGSRRSRSKEPVPEPQEIIPQLLLHDDDDVVVPYGDADTAPSPGPSEPASPTTPQQTKKEENEEHAEKIEEHAESDAEKIEENALPSSARLSSSDSDAEKIDLIYPEPEEETDVTSIEHGVDDADAAKPQDMRLAGRTWSGDR